jgi:hypothetical protein
MFLALVTQHAMHMHHIVICGLSGCTVFFHIINGTVSKKLLKVKSVLIISTRFV